MVFSAADICKIEVPINIIETCVELEQVENEWLVKSTCKNYLEWSYLVGQNISTALNFQDLYVPMLFGFVEIEENEQEGNIIWNLRKIEREVEDIIMVGMHIDARCLIIREFYLRVVEIPHLGKLKGN